MSKLLGIVILLNFAAVLVSNVAGFIAPLPDPTTGEPLPPLNPVRSAADRWCEATGQPQGWGMFDSGKMINSVWFEMHYEFADGSTHTSRSVASDPENNHGYHGPARHDRRAVFECAFLGRELVQKPPAEFNREYRNELARQMAVNHSAYEALYRAHYPYGRVGCKRAALRIHWRPVDATQAPGMIEVATWP